ncbi:MAG: helix-turn-helix transcriptional regulator [Tissierellia bacterium]|nr:helix-turn-helix transcriptional regulator [Tissierellia bacterium]
MILADKIMFHRKKLGMTQEELAQELNVSRQAVSKWEGAQSIPGIIQLIVSFLLVWIIWLRMNLKTLNMSKVGRILVLGG